MSLTSDINWPIEMKQLIAYTSVSELLITLKPRRKMSLAFIYVCMLSINHVICFAKT